jgi:hypothetical protein
LVAFKQSDGGATTEGGVGNKGCWQTGGGDRFLIFYMFYFHFWIDTRLLYIDLLFFVYDFSTVFIRAGHTAQHIASAEQSRMGQGMGGKTEREER